MRDWQPLTHLIDRAIGSVAPAIVCRVEVDGALLFEHCAGTLGESTDSTGTDILPVTSDTLFDYASLTKLFTASACLVLVDQGHLDLETRLVDILPEFGEHKLLGGAEDPITKQPLPADPRWQIEPGWPWFDTSLVTIRSLLTHSSGLPAWRSVYRACGRVPHYSSLMQRAEQQQRARSGLGALLGYPFVYPPRKSYAYSDIGLMLLGEAIAAVYQSANGQKTGHGGLSQAIDDLVTKPLGLSVHYLPDDALRSQIAPTEFCRWRNRRLVGEVHDENAAGIGGIAGHAGLFGTARDLCRLGLFFGDEKQVLGKDRQDESEGRKGPALSTALKREAVGEHLCSEDGVRRGLGWMLRSESNPSCSDVFSAQSFGHTGYTGTSLWYDPKRNLCVALLTNRVYYGRDPQAIADFRPAIHRLIAEVVDFPHLF